MASSNAFLVAFGTKEQRRNNNKKIKTLNTLLSALTRWIKNRNSFIMEANPNDTNDTSLDFYMGVSFSNYLNGMSIDGTFGNEINLRVTAKLFNIKFVIISTLGRLTETTITPQSFAAQGPVYLGHFV